MLLDLTRVERERGSRTWICVSLGAIEYIEEAHPTIPSAKSYIRTSTGSYFYVVESKEEILKKITFLKGES